MNASPYKNCTLCPRRCGVNREGGESGYCGETAALRAASALLHRGEEPPVTGAGGSGAIFITGCNLGCSFCQNYQISREGMGAELSVEDFASLCRTLEDRGAENINIVTGSHAAPAILAGYEKARSNGLTIPLVWNTSGYEGGETLELLQDAVALWLPDLKTLDAELAGRYFNAPDYPDAARRAILKMIAWKPGAVIVRHLALPGFPGSTRDVLRWFADNCSGRAQLSLMTQFTPVNVRERNLERFINNEEYDALIGLLEEFGIEDGFVQEPVTDAGWLPDFSRKNPFSAATEDAVWDWRGGFTSHSAPNYRRERLRGGL